MTFLLDWSNKKCTERELWQRHRYVFPDIKINFSCQLHLLLFLAAAKDAAPRDVGEDDGDKEENDGDGDHRHGDVHNVRWARLGGREAALTIGQLRYLLITEVQCWGSVTFWCGSGSADPTPFFSDAKDSRCKKINFFHSVFLYLTRRHIFFCLKNPIFAKILC